MAHDPRLRRVFLGTCWLPAALLLSYFAYVRATSGWGAFAGVYVLYAAVVLSGLLGALGLVLWVRTLARGTHDRLVLAGALLAGVVALWASARR